MADWLQDRLDRAFNNTPEDPRLNADGQPAPHINRERRKERDIDELIGMCKIAIADGRVSEEEAVSIQQWLHQHTEHMNEWPCTVLIARLGQIFEDGVYDPAEAKELLRMLVEFTGCEPVDQKAMASRVKPGLAPAQKPTSLPLDDPVPEIEFDGCEFVCTGKFAFGSRKECMAAVKAVEGEAAKNVTMELDYLIVGSLGSRDWLHSSYGTKIKRVLELREEHGCEIAIVAEEEWARQLAEELGRIEQGEEEM